MTGVIDFMPSGVLLVGVPVLQLLA
eukprot:SAG11_NODE_8578_length_999_cov_0.795556_2_plen_24_part_01